MTPSKSHSREEIVHLHLNIYFNLDLLVILQQNRSIADVCHRLYEQNLRILSSTPDSL